MIGALIIGLFGSLHCVGMCGPVIVAFMGPKHSWVGFFVYHSGRILSYVLIGIVLGAIGASVVLFQAQQIAIIVLGVVLIVIYGIPKLRNSLEKYYYQSQMYEFLKLSLARNISQKKRRFLSGIANGFFPCGLTYVAAAGAVAQGTVYSGVLFMVLFGLGTVPSLLLVSLFGDKLSLRLRSIIPRSVSVIAILSGTLMVFRGLLSTFPDFNHMVQANASLLITVCGM